MKLKIKSGQVYQDMDPRIHGERFVRVVRRHKSGPWWHCESFWAGSDRIIRKARKVFIADQRLQGRAYRLREDMR